jgi:hypothetical protein
MVAHPPSPTLSCVVALQSVSPSCWRAALAGQLGGACSCDGTTAPSCSCSLSCLVTTGPRASWPSRSSPGMSLNTCGVLVLPYGALVNMVAIRSNLRSLASCVSRVVAQSLGPASLTVATPLGCTAEGYRRRVRRTSEREKGFLRDRVLAPVFRGGREPWNSFGMLSSATSCMYSSVVA